MSSFIRSKATVQTGLTRFHKPETPCYDTLTLIKPFPFSYSNGVLDISYEGNNFKSRMVDISGVDPDDESDISVRIIGAPHLATELGNNFKEYIRSWREATIDAGSAIEVYTPCQVIRVQEAARANVDASSSSAYKISTLAPASDNYIAGTESNNYLTTYVFKTPLTFTIVEGGVTRYITFRTNLDQE